jgi:hypothetical protein
MGYSHHNIAPNNERQMNSRHRYQKSVAHIFLKKIIFLKKTPLLKKFGGKSIGVKNKNLAPS